MENLFKENKLIYMSPMRAAPQRQPEAQPKTSEGPKQLTPDEASKAAKTAIDTAGRLAKAIEAQLKKNPSNERLKKIHAKLVTLTKKLDDADSNLLIFENKERYARVITSTINQLNKVMDSSLPGIRKQILRTSLSTLRKKDISRQKWADALVSTFSMLKTNEQVTLNGVKAKRVGQKLTVNSKDYYLSTDGVEWTIKDRHGYNLNYSTDPLAGIYGKTEKYRVGTQKAEALAQKRQKPQKKPSKKPQSPENTEVFQHAQVGKALRFIRNSRIEQTVPQNLYLAFQKFIKDIKPGGVKAFKEKGLQAYISRSKDGKAYKIASKYGNLIFVQYYTGNRFGKLSEKKKFPSDPISKEVKSRAEGQPIRAKLKTATATKKQQKTKETTTGKPDKVLAMLQRQQKRAETEKRISKGMKKWVGEVKQAIAGVLKNLQSFSKLKTLAKSIQEESSIPFKKAADIAVKFKSRCEQCDRDFTLKRTTPSQMIKRLKSTTSVLPPKLETKYADEFKIKPGERRLASLEKGVPTRTPAVVKGTPLSQPRQNAKKPSTNREINEEGNGYKELAKAFKLDKKDINRWPGTRKNAIDLKLVFGLQEGKSPIMKDGEGNEFYFRLSSSKGHDTLSVYVRNKGETRFTLLFNEVDGERKSQAVAVSTSPRKTTGKGVSKEREAYDRNMGKKVKLLTSTFRRLKPSGDGVNFKLKDGTRVSVFRKNKDTFYTINANGEKESFRLSDGAWIRKVAQTITDNPKFVTAISSGEHFTVMGDKPKATRLSLREKADIKDSINELKKMLEGKKLTTVMRSNRQDLHDYLSHISGVHKSKSVEGRYDITTGYSLTVSKSGTIKLTHKGEGTLTYRHKDTTA